MFYFHRRQQQHGGKFREHREQLVVEERADGPAHLPRQQGVPAGPLLHPQVVVRW